MNELLVFFEMAQKKKKEMKKTIKMAVSKKTHFPAPPILNIFHENFEVWSMGEEEQLMWLKLYGCQVVWRKLKNKLENAGKQNN